MLYMLHAISELIPAGSWQSAQCFKGWGDGTMLEAHLTEQIQPLGLKTGGTENEIF